MNKGLFVISLDFELFWGIHDTFKIEEYYENVNNVKEVIPRLLSLFEKYDIHATFAIVGAIYHHSFEDFVNFSNGVTRPRYEKLGLSPYENENLRKERDYPELHFAPELIRMIRDAGQEIGTHTYSHYYCTEIGAELKSFEDDIKLAVKIARENGDRVKSIIFPRNQIGAKDFLKVIRENGILSYRGTPYGSYASKSPLWRIRRFFSAYFPISDETVEVRYEDNVINIPASHFLRAYSPLRLLNKLQLKRIEKSMKKVAIRGGVFHLWWHPHNMGRRIDANMQILESILIYYRELSERYGMKSRSMSEVEEFL